MKFIQSSIQTLPFSEGFFYELSGQLSYGGVVYFTIIPFKFDLGLDENPVIFIDDLKVLARIPPEQPMIAGSIRPVSYQPSRSIIDLYVFCGAITGDRPTSKNDLEKKYHMEAQKRVELFWNEVEKYFSMPPTHVFEHQPSAGSYFDNWVYWGFCYIFINTTTKQGILLAGGCFD